MVTSSSRLSYKDCYDLMDKAVESEKGIRVQFADEGAAMHMRVRVNSARKLDREDNRETFGDGHPMSGKSLYDDLAVKVRVAKDGAYLILEKRSSQILKVEDLSSADGIEVLEKPKITLNISNPVITRRT